MVLGSIAVLDLRVAEAQPTLDLFRGVEPGWAEGAVRQVEAAIRAGVAAQLHRRRAGVRKRYGGVMRSPRS